MEAEDAPSIVSDRYTLHTTYCIQHTVYQLPAANLTVSTMAQAFSSALDSAFMLDSDVNNLSQTVDQK
jgi:hypothetical protein